MALWILILVSAVGGCNLGSGEMRLQDFEMRQGCGPIACFVAARLLGVDTDLGEVAERCRWSPEDGSTVERLYQTLVSFDELDARVQRLQIGALSDCLGHPQTVGILFVRKGDSIETDHAVAAIRLDENGNLTMIDYPELQQVWSHGELQDRWDGLCILVSRRNGRKTSIGDGTYTQYAAYVLYAAGSLVTVVGISLLFVLGRQHGDVRK